MLWPWNAKVGEYDTLWEKSVLPATLGCASIAELHH